MVKFFIFSFLFISIIFAVIFVCAIYRYYHNVQNRQNEISSDYSQQMADQAKRKEEQITNAPDHYIQDFIDYYQPNSTEETYPTKDNTDSGYQFKLPDSLVQTSNQQVFIRDTNNLSNSYNKNKDVSDDYPIFIYVNVDYGKNMPDGNNQKAMENIVLYLLMPVYPDMTLDKVQELIKNNQEGTEIHQCNLWLSKDDSFTFAFYLRYPLG